MHIAIYFRFFYCWKLWLKYPDEIYVLYTILICHICTHNIGRFFVHSADMVAFCYCKCNAQARLRKKAVVFFLCFNSSIGFPLRCSQSLCVFIFPPFIFVDRWQNDHDSGNSCKQYILHILIRSGCHFLFNGLYGQCRGKCKCFPPPTHTTARSMIK